ncbi:MAG: DUF2809 domain-containing protein [Vallitalea sp.]|jgi:hypothetical protein|nr:DUF2809 domain-containing protein [Vallitalea sp.]
MKRIYIGIVILVVVLGLGSRKVTGIPLIVGDVLWAMMIFFIISIILYRKNSTFIFITTLIITYCVEFSQLYHSNTIDYIRSTFFGHLILGQGFIRTDLVAYLVGIVIACGLKNIVDKKYVIKVDKVT